GPWFIGKSHITVQKWELDFNPYGNPVTEFLIWVNLPGLPLEFWEPEVLFGIAKSLGKPIALDPVTKAKTRLTHARFC
ncbi:hypothetical protein KI387_017264, partial [Taxus chinensis]